MLCVVYLDNNDPEMAQKYFEYGMTVIDNNKECSNNDIDSFLDLKIEIDNELGKKKK
ncbi:MAG: hypothetical protein HY951_02705 [Bacteroidia bacterium]|nr:hypothetical protein [Bacteroidia bacterium]